VEEHDPDWTEEGDGEEEEDQEEPMRTLKEANDEQTEHSKRASENVRFLALAGFGVVWLLAGSQFTGLYKKELLAITGGLVLVLLADFGQYAFAAARWDRLIQRVEATRPQHRRLPDSKIRVPPRLLRPIYVLYWAKIGLLLLSYIGIASVVIFRLVTKAPQSEPSPVKAPELVPAPARAPPPWIPEVAR
jgi:hypothetical protein